MCLGALQVSKWDGEDTTNSYSKPSTFLTCIKISCFRWDIVYPDRFSVVLLIFQENVGVVFYFHISLSLFFIDFQSFDAVCAELLKATF